VAASPPLALGSATIPLHPPPPLFFPFWNRVLETIVPKRNDLAKTIAFLLILIVKSLFFYIVNTYLKITKMLSINAEYISCVLAYQKAIYRDNICFKKCKNIEKDHKFPYIYMLKSGITSNK
jgi:hypothetical protein